ncbi:unknown [Gryllus bimaculatus nudivirus]|uniref:Sulfhydryl oxidase n=1 Tax=Gryllus bimaculatus nudivirus TaxID=432587 RepID=A4L1X0_9VIRU|nr:hypothetical protein GrBNV_gp07 [Gryllus bimaculatus nudivirus]ABO45340.1 unknown [Gryllus bimaculatus nudivirus]
MVNKGFKFLIQESKKELKDLGSIDTVYKLFQPVFNEFTNYVADAKSQFIITDVSADYEKAYNNFIDNFLIKKCGFKKTLMVVRVNQYTTSDWGHLYWSFLHYASIILQYNIYTNKVTDTFSFAAFIMGIENILPCMMCRIHYIQNKQKMSNSAYLLNLMKRLCFGIIIQSVFSFHNFISNSIPGKPKSDFNVIDFQIKYYCSVTDKSDNVDTDSSSQSLKHEGNTPEKILVDWQGPTHVCVSLLTAVVSKRNYYIVNKEIKEKLYTENDTDFYNFVKKCVTQAIHEFKNISIGSSYKNPEIIKYIEYFKINYPDFYNSIK